MLSEVLFTQPLTMIFRQQNTDGLLHQTITCSISWTLASLEMAGNVEAMPAGKFCDAERGDVTPLSSENAPLRE